MRNLINVIITSSVMIIVVLFLRQMFGCRIKKSVMCILWALVAVRLLIPVQLFNNVINITDYVVRTVSDLWESESTTDDEIFIKEGSLYNETNNVTSTAEIEQNSSLVNPLQSVNDDSSEKVPLSGNISQIKGNFHGGIGIIDVLHIIWLAGVAITILIVVISNLIFARKLILTRNRIGVIDRIKIYQSDVTGSACLYGIIRPAIYLNTSVVGNEFIISHELTHYKHRDNWWSLVRTLCVCIYWFNPLVWVAAHFHREDCELFCDEAVVKDYGKNERIQYGEMLLNTAIEQSGRLSFVYFLSGASSGYRELKKRLERITDDKKTYRSVAFAILVVAMVVTVFSFGNETIKGSVGDESNANMEGKSAGQRNNVDMKNYVFNEYKYDLTHDGIDDIVIMELYGYSEDIEDVYKALDDTRKYVTVTVKDGASGKVIYTKNVGNSGSANGFISIVENNGLYYIMDGNMGVWQGEGLEQYTVYDFVAGEISVIDEFRVVYYVTEEVADRTRRRGEEPINKEQADEVYNSRIARWTNQQIILIECLTHAE